MAPWVAGHDPAMAQDKQGLRMLALIAAGLLVALVAFWLVWQYAAE